MKGKRGNHRNQFDESLRKFETIFYLVFIVNKKIFSLYKYMFASVCVLFQNGDDNQTHSL